MALLGENKVIKTFKRCSDNKIISYDACSDDLYPIHNPFYEGAQHLGLGIIWKINGVKQGSKRLCRFYRFRHDSNIYPVCMSKAIIEE